MFPHTQAEDRAFGEHVANVGDEGPIIIRRTCLCKGEHVENRQKIVASGSART